MLGVALNIALVALVISAVAVSAVVVVGLSRHVVNYWAVGIALVCVLALWQLYVIRVRIESAEVCAQHVERLGTALELYGMLEDGGYAPSLDYLVPFYFSSLPSCREGGVGDINVDPDTYTDYGYKSSGNNFTVYCKGNAHEGLGGAAAGFPQYSAREGLRYRQ